MLLSPLYYLGFKFVQTRGWGSPRNQDGAGSCYGNHITWAQKQTQVWCAEGLISTSILDPFTALSVANSDCQLGEECLPRCSLGEPLKEKNHVPVSMRAGALLVFCHESQCLPFFPLKLAFVYSDLTCIRGGQSPLWVWASLTDNHRIVIVPLGGNLRSF